LRYTKEAFTPHASHFATNSDDPTAATMGLRMRLQAHFDVAPLPKEVQVILTALKKYGMILVDNGAPMFLSGTPDSRWNNDNLATLRQVKASDFEVVLISPLYTRYNYPKGPIPIVNSVSATDSAGPGQPVTISWNVTYGEYYSLAPTIGALRTTSVVVYPTSTTTYTLTATNSYGRATGSVTVPVP